MPSALVNLFKYIAMWPSLYNIYIGHNVSFAFVGELAQN